MWESYSSGVAMPGAVSLEPPSLSTQSLLLTQALENAVKTYGMTKVVKSACAPGGAKSVMTRQQKLSDAVQNRPGKIFLWNADADAEICVKI